MPMLLVLARPSEAHQRDVIELAAAVGELLDHLDHLLTQFPGGDRPSPSGLFERGYAVTVSVLGPSGLSAVGTGVSGS